MRAFGILLLVFLFCSCNAPRAVIDYDAKVNFDKFDSYNFYREFKTGLNQLDEGRLLESIEAALQEKGLLLSQSPDLYLNIYAEEYEESNRNSLGIGVGGTGGNIGLGIFGGIPLGAPDTYLELTFDLIDARKDELVWQAVVTAKFDKKASPEAKMARFDLIVEKALKDYPPE